MANTKRTKRPDRSPKSTSRNKAADPARAQDRIATAKDTSTSAAQRLSGLIQRKETRVEIKPAKGRPMLTWVGKKPQRHAIAYPAQLVETFSTHPPSPRGRGSRGG